VNLFFFTFLRLCVKNFKEKAMYTAKLIHAFVVPVPPSVCTESSFKSDAGAWYSQDFFSCQPAVPGLE
jgi:hypothetical protein